MGNTARAFSSLGGRDPEDEPESKQTELGESLSERKRLGDLLASKSEDDDIDPVEAVRELREDV